MIGREYKFLDGKKKKPPKDPHYHENKLPAVPESVKSGEIAFAWDSKGDVIFTPIYQFYNKVFWDGLKEKTAIQTDYDLFKNTARGERFTQNAFQFSAAKSAAEVRGMQEAKFRPDGSIKEFTEYKRDAGQIADIQNDVWFRVENDMFERQMVQAEEWDRMEADRDLYPYWVYHGVMDDREREEHVELEGKTFAIGDSNGDDMLPPLSWNCRCWADTEDADGIRDKGLKITTNEEAGQLLKSNVNEQFRYNPAKQGMMPAAHHSYFDVLPSANSASSKTFDLPATDTDKSLTGLTSKGLHAALEIFHQWAREYHTDSRGNIIFQNMQSLTNIVFTSEGLHKVSKHPKGMDNIPQALQAPDEIWMRWADEDQQDVQRNYILFGKVCYVVITVAGVLQDAFAVSHGTIDNYRKGIPFLI